MSTFAEHSHTQQSSGRVFYGAHGFFSGAFRFYLWHLIKYINEIIQIKLAGLIMFTYYTAV